MATLIPIKPLVLGGTYPPTTPLTVLQALSAAALTELATKGDDIANPAGRTYFILINTDATKQTVNIGPMGKPDGMSVNPYSVDLAANTPYVFGPFNPNLFNSAAGSFRVGLTAANPKVIAVVLQLA